MKVPREETLRKPGVVPGPHYASLVLGDGQEWFCPRPTMVQRAVRDPQTGRITFDTSVTGIAVPYQQLLDTIESDRETYVALVIEVTYELLRQNYDLDDDYLPELFWFDPNSPESHGRFAAVERVCLGLNTAPKADPPGSA